MSVGRPVIPMDPAAPSVLSATPLTGDTAGSNDQHVPPRRRPEDNVFAETRVWTETEAAVHAGVDGTVFVETLAKVGAEWSPVDEGGGGLPGFPRDPAAGPQQQRERAALSSAPNGGIAQRKPLGLLSKAAWTKGTSSSSSKSSSFSSSSSSSTTTKASSLPSSSSSSATSKRDSQTTRPDNGSMATANSKSSTSNSSSSLGMVQGCSVIGINLKFEFHIHMHLCVNGRQPSPTNSNHNLASQAWISSHVIIACCRAKLCF